MVAGGEELPGMDNEDHLVEGKQEADNVEAVHEGRGKHAKRKAKVRE
jgi:hypothetical protein